MLIYKSKKGYFYKEYKNGKKIRISQKSYFKYKKKYKQKGGNLNFNSIEFINQGANSGLDNSNVCVVDPCGKYLVSGNFRGVGGLSKEIYEKMNYFRYTTLELIDIVNKSSPIFSNKLYISKRATNPKAIEIEYRELLNWRNENLVHLRRATANKRNGSNLYNTNSKKTFIHIEQNCSQINSYGYTNYEGCRYCGYYHCKNCVSISKTDKFKLYSEAKQWKDSIVCKNCYAFLKLSKIDKIYIKHNSITQGNCELIEYPTGEKIIHAYSYDYRVTQKTKDDAIQELSELYKEIFNKFKNSSKNILYLPPLSGGIFSGNLNKYIKEITLKSISNALIENTLDGKQIKLCCFGINEFNEFRLTKYLFFSTIDEYMVSHTNRNIENFKILFKYTYSQAILGNMFQYLQKNLKEDIFLTPRTDIQKKITFNFNYIIYQINYILMNSQNSTTHNLSVKATCLLNPEYKTINDIDIKIEFDNISEPIDEYFKKPNDELILDSFITIGELSTLIFDNENTTNNKKIQQAYESDFPRNLKCLTATKDLKTFYLKNNQNETKKRDYVHAKINLIDSDLIEDDRFLQIVNEKLDDLYVMFRYLDD